MHHYCVYIMYIILLHKYEIIYLLFSKSHYIRGKTMKNWKTKNIPVKNNAITMFFKPKQRKAVAHYLAYLALACYIRDQSTHTVQAHRRGKIQAQTIIV